MYGILGENDSDVETLKVIVRRIASDPKLPVETKGFDGCGELLRRGARQIQTLCQKRCSRFIIAVDADGPDPTPRHKAVLQNIVKPSNLKLPYCIIVPVQELEAWILADLSAASNVFSGWHPKDIVRPQSIQNPKEHLERLSRGSGRKPIYAHAVHNARMAVYIDLEKVHRRCSSFRSLKAFVDHA